MNFRKAAVLLVAHGSELSAEASGPIRSLARTLRRSGEFGEVGVAFWKEEPYLHQAFDAFEADSVLVVPIFTSQGYFTERVVPRELGVEGGTGPGGRKVWVAPPVGTHPRMVEILLDRALEAAPLPPEEVREATLVLVGHGTARHSSSGGTTFALAEALRREGRYGAVVPAFLDQAPGLEAVLEATTGETRIVVPFFISEGWHAGTTLPRDLDRGGGGRILYAKTVGTHPGMETVVRELLGGAPDLPIGGASTTPGGAAARFAREAFVRGLRDRAQGLRGGTTFLEAVLLPLDGAELRCELRHHLDRELPPDTLEGFRNPDDAEEIGGRTAEGEPRPLRTAPTLRRGWRIGPLDGEGVWRALGHLYPRTALHRQLAREGRLATTAFDQAAARQTGAYAGLEGMDRTLLQRAIEGCCAPNRCLRLPLWEPNEGVLGEGIPCPAPCPVLLSAARQALEGAEEGADFKKDEG